MYRGHVNKSTFGEDLFKRYLDSRGIAYEREPQLPGISQLFDFVVEHREDGKILLEVKDVENPIRPGFGGSFDPYRPIRSQIDYARKKFKHTSDYCCALILAAPPWSLAFLEWPETVLGAMYGDIGIQIPFNRELDQYDRDQATSEFIVGRGKMIRTSEPRHTRIAALITVHEYKLWQLTLRRYLNTDDGRSRAERMNDHRSGKVTLPAADATAVGVTVWENAVATRRLPQDLFRGPMDAWWEATEGGQRLGYIGKLRRELDIDKQEDPDPFADIR